MCVCMSSAIISFTDVSVPSAMERKASTSEIDKQKSVLVKAVPRLNKGGSLTIFNHPKHNHIFFIYLIFFNCFIFAKIFLALASSISMT